MADEKIRAHIFVKGLVQGVFFRSNTRKKAQQLGLRGWVKNLPDGKVEAVLEGEREKVEQMIEWAKRGPPSAQVDGVEIEWEKYKEEFNDFEIRYT